MNAVTDAIFQKTQDPHVRAAMVMGSRLESGWNPGSIGDGGTSFGAFQIHLPAHPGVTAQEAEDPSFAVSYMLGAYQNGASQVPTSLWSTDLAQASAMAAYYAERPAVMYPAHTAGGGGYRDVWSQVSQVLGGANLGPSGGSSDGGTDGTGGNGGTAQNASFLGFDINSVLKPLQTVMNSGYVFALIGGGVVVMGLGVYWMFRGSGPSVSVPVVNVTVPNVGDVRRYESKPQSGSTRSSGVASRYANASRVRTAPTIAGRVVEGTARARAAVPSGSKRQIERA